MCEAALGYCMIRMHAHPHMKLSHVVSLVPTPIFFKLPTAFLLIDCSRLKIIIYLKQIWKNCRINNISFISIYNIIIFFCKLLL